MSHSSTKWLFVAPNTGEGRPRLERPGTTPLAVIFPFFLFAAVIISVAAPVSSASTSPARAEVSELSTTAYGPVLVVGNGPLKGFPLYAFTGDQGGTIRCGTSRATGYDLGPVTSMPLMCTGPESDLLKGVKSDDWPAFTSVSRPLAGLGVNSGLLSRVNRPGIGQQVTYNGHPLYLFDPISRPFLPQGEGYMETIKPLAPWHGYWYLVSASGDVAPARAKLEQGVLPDGSKVLSVVRDANVSPLDVTLYAFSGDGAASTDCRDKCALTWIPLLTDGAPSEGRGVNAHLVGTLRRGNGTEQVTYRGQPLFLYAKEKVFLTPSVHLKSTGTAGNGKGLPIPGGDRSETIRLH
jgi:predicted lipoprotein with Yx(FWY)xxD motif